MQAIRLLRSASSTRWFEAENPGKNGGARHALQLARLPESRPVRERRGPFPVAAAADLERKHFPGINSFFKKADIHIDTASIIGIFNLSF